MKLYAPKYYKQFKCIADKCEHSCCIGWEIDIDANSLEKYKGLCDGYGKVISDSISTDDTPHFCLAAKDRCPHLNEQGLCRIILNLGEGYLCDICREHPRFYNYTSVAEAGIGLSCPEAARVVLSAPDYAVLEEVGEVEATPDELGFDGRALRAEIYDVLSDAACGLEAALGKIYSRFDIDVGDDGAWKDIIFSLEYLNEDHRDLFMNYSSHVGAMDCQNAEYLKRFLAYLIYRHGTEAFDEEDFRSRLAFCLFCQRLLASLIVTERAATLDQVAHLASIISEELEYSEDNTLALMP